MFSGSIFHVRVHTPQRGLEHALLYSIGVNLPAHRVGQLDRILVLASPINDINIHAWDLNRVKRFIRLDIGVQMELCASCTTSRAHGQSITFILDKLFHAECLEFLCHEAHVGNAPVKDGSLLVYPVNHSCVQKTTLPESIFSQPPSYVDSQFREKFGERDNCWDAPPEIPPHKNNLYSCVRDVCTYDSSKLQSTSTAASSSADNLESDVPPRTITRKKYESAIPAIACPYTNFQPHLFQQSGSRYESPYQISSRIIITNSGEVQYERNVLGKKSQHHGGFHFKDDMPLPPRTHAGNSPTKVQSYSSPRSPNLNKRPVSSPTLERKSSDPQLSDRKLQKRASELSDSDDSYVPIPDVVLDPSRSHHQAPLTAFEPQFELPPYTTTSLPRLPSSVLENEYQLSDDMVTSTQSIASDDYDDSLLLSQQVRMTHSSGVSQVTATQEVRSDPHVPVPKLDISTPPATPPRPHKPAVKPRRSKLGSESCRNNGNSLKPSIVQRSLTIPINYPPAPTYSLPSEMTSSSSHHTLNTLSPNGSTSSSPPAMDTVCWHASTENVFKYQPLLTNPPLTPPIPKPRLGGTRVRFNIPRHAEDDSWIGRCSARTMKAREKWNATNPFYAEDSPISDV